MITVNFGLKSIITEKIMTVENLTQDPNFKAILGFGDNVEVYQDGVLVPNSTMLADDKTYAINTVACGKGK